MLEAKTTSYNTADYLTRIGVVNAPLLYAPVVAAICIVVCRGWQLRKVVQAIVRVIAEVVK